MVWLLQLLFVCIASQDCNNKKKKSGSKQWSMRCPSHSANSPAAFSIIRLRNLCSCCSIKVSVFLSDRDLDYRQMLTEIFSSELQCSYTFHYGAINSFVSTHDLLQLLSERLQKPVQSNLKQTGLDRPVFSFSVSLWRCRSAQFRLQVCLPAELSLLF